MTKLPVLYSFRRCPYAMRARLALAASGTAVELREVMLKDKPPSMLAASPKGTVPVLVLPATPEDGGGQVIGESDEIMVWALARHDPDGWLDPWHADHEETRRLISENDGPFKRHLDRYKYPVRYPDENIVAEEQRDAALSILTGWNARLTGTGWLIGEKASLADFALLPFVRQYAHVDKDWFDAQEIPAVQGWLARFLGSSLFASIMEKYDPWQEGTQGITFTPARLQ